MCALCSVLDSVILQESYEPWTLTLSETAQPLKKKIEKKCFAARVHGHKKELDYYSVKQRLLSELNSL